jgi:5-methylcytosine-specific restriction endonuclease McrA
MMKRWNFPKVEKDYGLEIHNPGELRRSAMSPKKPGLDREQQNQIVAEARQNRNQREKTYREQALKMFPKICARCGREFSGKKLRELTVHHKDHNHDYNPPDGSNWELLCLYCHDNEHSRYEDSAPYSDVTPGTDQEPSGSFKPFADLEALLKNKK